MAVILVTTSQTFFGLTGDTRPTSGVPAGSRYWATDTGHWEQYDGSSWTVEIVQGINVEGDTAHDAADAGNPVKLGGRYQSGTSDIVADNDRVDGHFDKHGKLGVWIGGHETAIGADVQNTWADGQLESINALYVSARVQAHAPDGSMDRLRTLGDTAGAGLGVLAVGLRVPGAGEVLPTRSVLGATSTTRSTVLTPGSGKKLRVIKCLAITDSSTVTNFQVYFGTGANITTNAGKEVMEARLDLAAAGEVAQRSEDWPEGAGTVGAADEVLSVRTDVDIGANGKVYVWTREE